MTLRDAAKSARERMNSRSCPLQLELTNNHGEPRRVLSSLALFPSIASVPIVGNRTKSWVVENGTWKVLTLRVVFVGRPKDLRREWVAITLGLIDNDPFFINV